MFIFRKFFQRNPSHSGASFQFSRGTEVIRILVADPLSAKALELLKEVAEFDVAYQPEMKGDELAEVIPHFDSLLIRGTRIDSRLLEKAGSLRLIVRAGNGLDNVDLEAARRMGIEVRNTPEATAVSVAEYTIGLLIFAARYLGQAFCSMKEGKWDRNALFNGVELQGKTLGIVGFGRIGSQVGRRALAFGIEVVFNDIRTIDTDLSVQALSLDELLDVSDFISLHVPLDQSTRNLIGWDHLSRMKPDAILINTSRGGVLDDEALLKTLEEERLRAAVLDVFVDEPPKNDRLIQHPRIYPFPHLGAGSGEGQARIHTEVVKVVKEFFNV